MARFYKIIREQAGRELIALAQKIVAKYFWNDLVLPEDVQAQLREVCQRAAFSHQVMTEWGFHRKLSKGRGVKVLFAGPPGTGKNMAAGVVANELGLDL